MTTTGGAPPSVPSIVSTAHGGSGGRSEYSIKDPTRDRLAAGSPHALMAPSITRFNDGATPQDARDPLATANSKVIRAANSDLDQTMNADVVNRACAVGSLRKAGVPLDEAMKLLRLGTRHEHPAPRSFVKLAARYKTLYAEAVVCAFAQDNGQTLYDGTGTGVRDEVERTFGFVGRTRETQAKVPLENGKALVSVITRPEPSAAHGTGCACASAWCASCIRATWPARPCASNVPCLNLPTLFRSGRCCREAREEADPGDRFRVAKERLETALRVNSLETLREAGFSEADLFDARRLAGKMQRALSGARTHIDPASSTES